MKKKHSDIFFGKNNEIIPNIAFQAMSGVMKLMDLFGKHSSKNFQTLGLKPGQVVIDYGCGPGRYIKDASHVVGESGKVIAVDIHPLAIKKVQSIIDKYKLSNVEVSLAKGYASELPSETADVVYALDMFHMVERPVEFLLELCRLIKKDGILIIEDGHQSRSETIQKINKPGLLVVSQEKKSHVVCRKL
ncbi:MAG: methyltransferase domain-containing protein [Myxococcota bacterium]|nr:methyltransferase domain-containing protein [Myxococcota bacterium]